MFFLRFFVHLTILPLVPYSSILVERALTRFTCLYQERVSLYVGDIPSSVGDLELRRALSTCGKIFSWNRIQDLAGKLENFGFVEFENLEGTLRALRVLPSLRIAEKPLLINPGPKIRAVLDGYLA